MPARRLGRAQAYLRRSTARQELGIKNQLEWAISEASRLHVRFDATLEDLDRMETSGIKELNGLFLDDGVSGADLSREAFRRFRETSLRDQSVSHLLIYKADRFARPQLAGQAMQMEIELLLAGMTVCFHNRISEPRELGLTYFAQDVQLLYEYSLSGQYLADLAERVLRAQAILASRGFWTGGTPPYGFGRVLVDANGTIVVELADGSYVRREGCHVRLRPKDLQKIRVWLQILDWFANRGWGTKRIARHLNELGIPSPGAGRQVVVRGVRRMASGKWEWRRVGRLIANRTIIGEIEYAKDSEGAHRRFSPEGPRLLSGTDRNDDGKPKVVSNVGKQRIIAQGGFEPLANRDLFDACQVEKEQRGQSQRGIPRSSPADYPLSTRVYDLTEGCGSVMYGSKERSRRLYLCARYAESKGRQCHRHLIDAEAALKFVLAVLRQRVIQLGGRQKIRERLVHLAARGDSAQSDHRQRDFECAQERQRRLDQELKAISGNLARAQDADVFAAIQAEFKAKQRELQNHGRLLADLRTKVEKVRNTETSEQQVNRALELLDQLGHVTLAPAARISTAELLSKLDFLMGLRFAEKTRGKRRSFVPVGGIITIGDADSPIRKKHVNGVRPPVADGDSGGRIPAAIGDNMPACGSESRRHEDSCMGKGAVGSTPATPTGRCAFKA